MAGHFLDGTLGLAYGIGVGLLSCPMTPIDTFHATTAIASGLRARAYGYVLA